MEGGSYASNWHFAPFCAVWSRVLGATRKPRLRGQGHLHPDGELDEGTAPKDKFWRPQATDYENDRATWCLLKRPATALEVFELSLCSGHYIKPPVLSPSGFKVFNHDAPSLKVFNAPYIRPDLRASWTSQLRVLELHTPIPVYELLEALKKHAISRIPG